MDERLVSMYRRFTWRILSNYVTSWEFEQLKIEITDYEQWCAAWSRHAARHVERGDAALAAGRRLTAGDAYLRGALAYHWASFVFTHDQAQLRAALEAMGDAWARAAPLAAPPLHGGPVTTVIYPDGVHILNNLWHQARPLVADWLAETL
jgi:hypothetical protein